LLAAEAAALRAADSRAAREALSTPLTIGGELENFAGTGALSGTRLAETTFRVGKRIELGGKQAARRASGQTHVLRQRNTAALARADVIALTSLRFIQVLADQARLAAAKERTAFASKARNEVARWVQAGRNPDSDLAAADITLADAELSEEHAAHELLASRQTLAASWGGVEVDFAEAPATWSGADHPAQLRFARCAPGPHSWAAGACAGSRGAFGTARSGPRQATAGRGPVVGRAPAARPG